MIDGYQHFAYLISEAKPKCPEEALEIPYTHSLKNNIKVVLTIEGLEIVFLAIKELNRVSSFRRALKFLLTLEELQKVFKGMKKLSILT